MNKLFTEKLLPDIEKGTVVLPQAGYISLIDELSTVFEAAKDELIEVVGKAYDRGIDLGEFVDDGFGRLRKEWICHKKTLFA